MRNVIFLRTRKYDEVIVVDQETLTANDYQEYVRGTLERNRGIMKP